MSQPWHTQAKCAGDDLDRYVLDDGPHWVINRDRDETARELCAGCPVATECLTEALADGDHGVVRGGQWLTNRHTPALT